MTLNYIEPPIETDPEILSQESFDIISARFPGWVPNDANLETVLIEAAARMTAEARDVASAVPTEIFRYFGGLVGVPPTDATYATAITDWTLRDTAGYTIPEGTQVGIRLTGDVVIPFVTTAAAVVAPGSSTALNVPIQAVDAGNEASGASGTVELLDTLDFVTTITLDAPAAGGTDAEDDDAYLNRLTKRLRLPVRPVLASDFAILALDIPAVFRAIGIDNFNPAGGGAFTGNTTNGSTTITTISSFTNITVGSEISGAGIPAGSKVESVNVGASTMVISRAATATAATVALTSSGTYGVEKMVTVASVGEDGLSIGTTNKAALDAYLQSVREPNMIVNIIDPTYTTIDVTFTAKAHVGFDIPTVEAAAETAVAEYLSPANWGIPPQEVGDVATAEWINEPVVRYLELAQVINQVAGINYIQTLTLRKGAEAMASADVILNGHVTMPLPGAIAGTVT